MPRRHRSVLSTLAAVLAAALTATVASMAPVQAAAPSYVALGDSYSSGVGTRSYIDDGSTCQRSTYAYPSLVAAAKGYRLNFRACSGATTADVTSTQLSALSSTTGYVTISVGGNDAGFADVITECALPAWASDCAGAVSAAQSFIRTALPGRLSTLYASIRSRAPKAKVVVVGYPKIFMGEDCNAATWFSPADETILNDTATLLDSVTASAAAARGFSFVNPISRFTGHAVCDATEWINGFSSPISESYHPNRSGQSSGYTPLVSTPLTGAALTVTAATRQKAAATAPALAEQQRAYADQDSTIQPEVVRAPDRAQLRRIAKRKGIDFGKWAARRG
ncbi:GDSL-like Lipase/Acylhydrolase family protein [Nocardioides terrae]|uniref:GDSL-like Lipase/Acylhydrolase family protein n=1 Tax=Nocardioides terrae TaxID=574651 RepID=A0A1I1GUY4_9ACTN|nr:SGNH/GDSL hydrolase family protein [Nocardioides terrae]SFC12993.1 GDSL-like Lipase/Acylhydrolase family protein [Nocardioides terrae]